MLHKVFRLWLLVFVICVAAFLSGGCGGSASSSSSGNSDDKTIANNEPNTYDTQTVLNGTWIVINQEDISVTVDSSDNTLDMLLITASMTFSNTYINGSSGMSFVTSHETWHSFLNGDTRTHMGIQSINLDNQAMTMMQAGADKWRCEVYDQYRNVLNIEILAENVIQVSEHRIAALDGSIVIDYEVTFTMKKQN